MWLPDRQRFGMGRQKSAEGIVGKGRETPAVGNLGRDGLAEGLNGWLALSERVPHRRIATEYQATGLG